MQPFYMRWRSLFLFSLGVAVSTAFIMQWLASDFWINDQRFSILGLELFYSKKEVIDVLSQIRPPSRLALNYHLTFDFAFMTGLYPAIASLCMLMRERVRNGTWRNLLFALAMLQPVAWAFDITENIFLLNWLEKPEIGDEFSTYHNIVVAKWLIALTGALCAISVALFKKGERKVPRVRQ
ncbi:MAG TPA: hypothetical protein VFP87_10025 [Chitinophagaceae bacterium]|nr:hypothetical protein [Chitinophagaceae bacterium]